MEAHVLTYPAGPWLAVDVGPSTGPTLHGIETFPPCSPLWQGLRPSQRRRRPDGERWSVQQPRIRAIWSEPRVALRGEGEKANVQRRRPRPALVPRFPGPCHCPPPVKGRWGQRGPTVRSGSWWPQVQVQASCVTLGKSLPLSESCP